jgi:HSP20 family protein
MAMVRYNPWRVDELQNEINRLFSNWGDNESSAATAGWMPNVDIQEYNDRFQLFVDVPGVDPSQVEITLDNGVLSISGERQLAATDAGEEVVNRHTERGHGRFHRRFTLPDTVDAEKVAARNHNGVLEISIPKQAKAQPRRIQVAA